MHQLFSVNSAGLPAYLGRSIQYVEEEFSKAADGGRTETGLMHFGNGLHTVEDYFAHSNWVEIAVGSLIKNGKLKLDFSKATEVDSALQKDQEERTAKGLDAVGTLAGQTEGGRPILTTGTYVLSDTFASIAEFISSGLRDFEPFEAKNKKRGRATTERLLAYYEARSGSGAGPTRRRASAGSARIAASRPCAPSPRSSRSTVRSASVPPAADSATS